MKAYQVDCDHFLSHVEVEFVAAVITLLVATSDFLSLSCLQLFIHETISLDRGRNISSGLALEIHKHVSKNSLRQGSIGRTFSEGLINGWRLSYSQKLTEFVTSCTLHMYIVYAMQRLESSVWIVAS